MLCSHEDSVFINIGQHFGTGDDVYKLLAFYQILYHLNNMYCMCQVIMNKYCLNQHFGGHLTQFKGDNVNSSIKRQFSKNFVLFSSKKI